MSLSYFSYSRIEKTEGQKANDSPCHLYRVRVQHQGCLFQSLPHSAPIPVRAVSTATHLLTNIKAEGWFHRLVSFSIQGVQCSIQCTRQAPLPLKPNPGKPVFSVKQACIGNLHCANACGWEQPKHCSCELSHPDLAHTGPHSKPLFSCRIKTSAPAPLHSSDFILPRWCTASYPEPIIPRKQVLSSGGRGTCL